MTRFYIFAEAAGLLLILMLLMLLPTAGYALSGKVLDPQGKPISGALITDQNRAVFSAADGSFNLKTTADSIFVTRIGYHKLAIQLSNFASPLVLIPSEIILPTVRVKAIEYKPISPSLNASIIHPDTNARVESTSELLLENPSFSTTDIQLSGERQTLSLLGSFSRHCLVLWDGVVLNPAGEAFDFSKLPQDQISYIEVIKGNSSVYGGSAAIGGIIHVHSKSEAVQRLPKARISTTAGSWGLFKQVYGAALGGRALSLNAEYTHQTAKNNFPYDTPSFWNAEPELERLHNRKTADSYYLKGSVFGGTSQLDYTLNAGTFIRQLPGPINFLDLYDASRLSGAYAQHHLRGSLVHHHLASELLLWWNSDQSSYHNLESTNPYGANHYRQKQQHRGIKAGSNLGYETASLGWDAEYSDINYQFKNYLNASRITGKRDNSSLSLRAQYRFFPLFMEYKVLGAVRGDYSEAKLHPTWRLENELKLPYADLLVLGGYAGTAFSQPSLFDMYWIGDSETVGNPDLKNETSFGYNLYGELGISRFRIKLAYYHNLVENLIQWRQYYLNGVNWKPFNVGRADIRNYELESHLGLGKYFGLSSSFTYTDAVDMSKNADGSPSPTYHKHLVYTPELKANARLSYEPKNWGASLSYSFTGKQYSTPDNLIEPLAAFDNLDASLFGVIALSCCDLRLDLKANNLMNKRYDIYAYTPQPGFNWSTRLSISTKNYTEPRTAD